MKVFLHNRKSEGFESLSTAVTSVGLSGIILHLALSHRWNRCHFQKASLGSVEWEPWIRPKLPQIVFFNTCFSCVKSHMVIAGFPHSCSQVLGAVRVPSQCNSMCLFTKHDARGSQRIQQTATDSPIPGGWLQVFLWFLWCMIEIDEDDHDQGDHQY